MTSGLVGEAEGLLSDALFAVPAGAGAEELIAALRVQAAVERRVHRAMVQTVAELLRIGAFAERGQRAETALADLWGVERGEARRVVLAAEQVGERVDLQGQVLPPRLPATAAAFAAGEASLRHVEVIARLMGGATAGHLPPEVAAEAEVQIAARTADYTPTELRTWGAQLLELLDQDGAEPDDHQPEPVERAGVDPQPERSGWEAQGPVR